MTLEPRLRNRIFESVAEGFPEQIEFTKQLVRFPSVRGAEHAIQDFVFRSYKDHGLLSIASTWIARRYGAILVAPSLAAGKGFSSCAVPKNKPKDPRRRFERREPRPVSFLRP